MDIIIKVYEQTSAEVLVQVKINLKNKSYKAKYPKMPKGYFHSFLNEFDTCFSEQHNEIYNQLT